MATGVILEAIFQHDFTLKILKIYAENEGIR